MPLTPPKLVIFDMDDVLLRYDPDARRAAMGDMSGKTGAEVRRLIWTSGIESASDAGKLSIDAYLNAISTALGIPFGRADWARTRGLSMHLNPDVVRLAAAIKPRTRLALLTNNGHIMKEHFDVLVPSLREIFGARMHVAAEFRTKKPDPTIYTRLLAIYGVSPPDGVMIDDRRSNVEGALAAGLRAHRFHDAAALEAYLTDLSLI